MRLLMNLAAFAALSIGSMKAGTLQYQVELRANGFQFTELNFALLPRNGVPLPVEAIITNFTFSSALNPLEGAILGTPTGSISSTLILSNEAGGEAYFREVLLPSVFRFSLTLTGAGVGAGASGNAETVFSLDMVNRFGFIVGDQSAVEIVLAGNRPPTIKEITINRTTFATVTPVTEAVPEPASWLMMGSALVLIARRMRA